jgi:hypothetical protein
MRVGMCSESKAHLISMKAAHKYSLLQKALSTGPTRDDKHSIVPRPHQKPNKLFGKRLFFSKNQSRRTLIMYSTILHKAEDKAIGRNAVGEVLGLGMGMT